MNPEIIPSGAALGAEVLGVDLRSAPASELGQFVLQAWHTHLVLLFRDQQLEDEDLIRMADDFGGSQVAGSRAYYLKAGLGVDSGRVSRHPGITIVSNLDESGRPVRANAGTGSFSIIWHTDNSYVETPPKGSILYGVQVPVNGGGDTSFANQYLAYDRLPESLRERIEGLHIKHDTSRNTAGRLRPSADLPIDYEGVVGPIHPLVRVHPDTGKRALYLGRRYQAPSSYIVEMPDAQGESLLDELWGYATAPDLVWTHSWLPGDVIIWDNRCTLHTRSAIDETQPRELHRTLVAGEPVIGTAAH